MSESGDKKPRAGSGKLLAWLAGVVVPLIGIVVAANASSGHTASGDGPTPGPIVVTTQGPTGGPTDGPTTQSPAPVITTHTPVPPPPPPPTTHPAEITYTAQITAYGDVPGLDLDDLQHRPPLTNNSSQIDIGVDDLDGTFTVYGNYEAGSAVQMTGQPSYSDCVQALNPSAGVHYKAPGLQSGQSPWLCILTSEQRIVAAHITSFSHSGNGSPASAAADFIVWT